jgi:hypothetical protein
MRDEGGVRCAWTMCAEMVQGVICYKIKPFGY